MYSDYRYVNSEHTILIVASYWLNRSNAGAFNDDLINTFDQTDNWGSGADFYHQSYSSTVQYVVCQEYSHSTRAGVFGTENNYSVTGHTGYGSMQLNYHKGEYLSSLGDSLIGGYWYGADQHHLPNGGGLFHFWHYNATTAFYAFGSLSR